MKKNFVGAAKQAHQLEREHPFCLSCSKAISHPICPYCISRGFFDWAANYPKEKSLLENIRNFLSRNKIFDETGIPCVSCKEKRASICPKCFTEFLYSQVKRAGLGVRALTEFLFIFNFDFGHDAYSKDLEALGGY